MAKGKKRSKKMSTTTKVVVGLGAAALAVGGFILYKRSKQPGLSTGT
jgi:LPXTG-motif cell wall-anchored protein